MIAHNSVQGAARRRPAWRLRRVLLRYGLIAAMASVAATTLVAEPAVAQPVSCVALFNRAEDDMRWSNTYMSLGNYYFSVGDFDWASQAYEWSKDYAILARENTEAALRAGC